MQIVLRLPGARSGNEPPIFCTMGTMPDRDGDKDRGAEGLILDGSGVPHGDQEKALADGAMVPPQGKSGGKNTGKGNNAGGEEGEDARVSRSLLGTSPICVASFCLAGGAASAGDDAITQQQGASYTPFLSRPPHGLQLGVS